MQLKSFRQNYEQDWKCMYNITLRRYHETNVAAERQQVLHVLCVCVALVTQHAKYCHLWPAYLYSIFLTLSHKRHEFRKQVIKHKISILILSTGFF